MAINAHSIGVRIKTGIKEKGVPKPLAPYTALKEVDFLPPKGTATDIRSRTAAIENGTGEDGVLGLDQDATLWQVAGVIVKGLWHRRAHVKADSTHDYTSDWAPFWVGE